MFSSTGSATAESNASSSTSARLRRESKKKALLIGINGLSSPNADLRELHGPHQDVAEMRGLLIATYDYKEDDIQVLVDDGVPEHVQPDRQNIMIAIENLVNDTRSGDKLFFHYCGHTIQVPTKSRTEEDGLDECLVPLDGEERMITDNELRAHLVDTLPVGASLVAVFDSCHSASLLDLEHLRCNRVFVPWISKGKRQSDDMRNNIVRRLDIPAESPSWATKSRTIYQSSRTSPTRIRSRRTSIDTLFSPVLSPRRSPRSPLSSASTVWNRPTLHIPEEPSDFETQDSGIWTGYAPRRLSISRSPTVSRKSHIPAPLKLWDDNKENTDYNLATGSPQSSKSWYTPSTATQSALPSTGTLCESPLQAFCQGWCRTEDDVLLPGTKKPEELADVISLGSCKDSELSWENEKGISMTRALVQVLNEDPHPTLRDLVTKISHTLHGLARERHLKANAWKKYRRSQAIKSSGLGSFDTDSFQHPQIGSHRPLDMGSSWDV
ncbi:peptidase C14, caspase domain-containing protein [Mycena epipterygia]|nr:peptidase C14, caspase domain-containing protein [Mycena epipterygia]